jgi:NitT/TauT family transport system substrate-binding protein
LILALVAALTLTACGGPEVSTGKALEKSTLTLGMIPVTDVVALYIADRRGYFKQEGLTIKTEVIQTTGDALPKIKNGTMDLTFGAYFTFLAAVEKGEQFRIVADATQAKSNIYGIAVAKDSLIQSVKDLKGKKVAITSPDSLGEMAVANSLRIAGLDPEKDVQWVPMAFPQVGAALQSGEADAGWLAEPFLTSGQKDQGLRVIADTMTGAMTDFPISGWATSEEWTKKYPRTMAAFQRALLKGQHDAASDRHAVEEVLPTYTKIDPVIVGVITMGVFPTSLNATRIQRVADLMLELGYLSKKVEVAPLLMPLAQ